MNSSPSNDQGVGQLRGWRGKCFAYAAIVAATILAFGVYHSIAVGTFYASHIAHYDSVGTLLYATQTLNVYAEKGYAAAISHAWQLPPLSIVQNLFVAFAAPLLQPVPASIQLYNVVAVSIALIAVAIMAYRLGLSAWVGSLVVMSFFLPDVLYYWNLGLFDFRRETGFYSLLTAALAFSAAITLSPKREGALFDGFALGLLCGLFLCSRDNAAPVGAGLIFMPTAALWVRNFLAGNASIVAQQILGSFLGFSPFLLVFALRLGDILSRLFDPLTMYANGGDSVDSFVGNFMLPVRAVIGGDSYPFNDFQFATIILLAALGALLLVTFLVSLWQAKSSDGMMSHQFITSTAPSLPSLLFLACWPPVFMHLFLSFGAKWASGQGLIAGIAPYVPACVGITFLVTALAKLLDRGAGRAGCIAGALAIAVSVPVRAETRMIEYPPEMFPAHVYLGSLVTKNGGSPVFAELADSDLRVPSIMLLAAMKGLPEPKRLRFSVEGAGDYDMQIATPAPDRIPVFLHAIETAALCDSDFIIINPDNKRYSDNTSPLLIQAHGASLIDNLRIKLAASPQTKIFLTSSEFVVLLDNTSRSECPDKSFG